RQARIRLPAVPDPRAEIDRAPLANPGAAESVCKGPPDAILEIVEFSDLQCPACREAAWILDGWQSRRRAEVRLCFRHYPLDPACNSEVSHAIHPHACEAAYAIEAAGRQDRFWQFEAL